MKNIIYQYFTFHHLIIIGHGKQRQTKLLELGFNRRTRI
jgi:hypothetical protein